MLIYLFIYVCVFLQTAHKLKPFFGARVCFVGFSSDETKHMHEVLEANGGQVTNIDDPLCTHVVSNDIRTYTNHIHYWSHTHTQGFILMVIFFSLNFLLSAAPMNLVKYLQNLLIS